MRFRHKLIGSIGLLVMATSLSGCQLQVVIEEGALKNWYWSRLAWVTVTTFVIGGVIAKFLCRLPIRAPLLDCIRAARLHFTRWIVVLTLILTPLFLWVDALMTQPFGDGNQLGAGSVFFLVILEWRTLALMLWVALTFCLSVAVFTRVFFGRTCNCKYAFLGKSRRPVTR